MAHCFRRMSGNAIVCATNNSCTCVSPFRIVEAEAALTCACNFDTEYADWAPATCKPRDVCPAGFYVAQAGTTSTNRICYMCHNGTFSVAENSELCKPWTTCANEGNAGNVTSDRVCEAAASTSAADYALTGGVVGACTLAVFFFAVIMYRRRVKRRHRNLFVAIEDSFKRRKCTATVGTAVTRPRWFLAPNSGGDHPSQPSASGTQNPTVHDEPVEMDSVNSARHNLHAAATTVQTAHSTCSPVVQRGPPLTASTAFAQTSAALPSLAKLDRSNYAQLQPDHHVYDCACLSSKLIGRARAIDERVPVLPT